MDSLNFSKLLQRLQPEETKRLKESANLKAQQVVEFKEKANEKAAKICKEVAELKKMITEAQCTFNNLDGILSSEVH